MEDRRLAAIMFTDIVGYTALMGSDEKKAFEVLRKNRNLHKPIITKYQGKFLKEMGDGILASFDTASDAVRCASTIQNLARKEDIELRIGIHLGEVVFQEGDVLGDGVNVASRLEEMAEAGSIYISDAIYKNVKNKEGIKTEFIEEKTLKNVDEPVKVYRVECEEIEVEPISKEKQKTSGTKVLYYILAGLIIIIVGGLIWYKLLRRPDSEIEKSIAVLPFKNIGGSNNNQILCDGMQEEILNNLQYITDLNVLSRTSVEKYQNTTINIKEIGKELNTGNILEGSVRMQGNKFRIIVQLIHAQTGHHLWSGEFDGTLSDSVFIIQSKIAEEIASKLNIAISLPEKQQINKIPTSNYGAYEKYRIGRNYLENHWRLSDPKDLVMAEKFFRESLEMDPNIVMGYDGMAEIYRQKFIWDSVNYCAEMMIKIDPSYKWGYLHKGRYYKGQGSSEIAIETFKKALEIDPNFIWAYNEIGQTYCFYLEDYVNGLSYLLKAGELYKTKMVPPDPSYYGFLGTVYLSVGDYKKANQNFIKSIEINPHCWVSNRYCYSSGMQNGWGIAIQIADSLLCNIPTCESLCYSVKFFAYFELREYDLSLTFLKESIKNGYIPEIGDSVTLAFIYDKLGKEYEATEILNACSKSIDIQILEYRDDPNYMAYLYMNLSSIHLTLNEKDKALNYLKNAAQYDLRIVDGLEKDPEFEKLYDDPEFKALVKQAQDEKAAIRAQVREMEERGDLDL